MAMIFCGALIVSNIFEIKIFNAGPLVLTGGFLIFPITYIINDCLAEVYGFNVAKRVILASFIINLVLVLIGQLVIMLPPAEFWDGQEHFSYVLHADLRIMIASMAAFICGSLINAKVMVRMKILQQGKGFGWRAILSTLVGESVDSLIFFPIAFYHVGLDNLLKMMVTQIILKTLYEVILLPVTSRFVAYLEKK